MSLYKKQALTVLCVGDGEQKEEEEKQKDVLSKASLRQGVTSCGRPIPRPHPARDLAAFGRHTRFSTPTALWAWLG